MEIMKKNFLIYLSTLLVCVLINPAFIYASTEYVGVEEVFEHNQVEKLYEEIQEQAILPDKLTSTKLRKPNSFATLSIGSYPTRKGVILVTKDAYKGLIPTGHAAIIYSRNIVIESLIGGVTSGKNDWNTSKSTCYGVTVNGTTTAQDAIAADWCYNRIGKPYNFNYLNTKTRNSFYCSQLIWAAFLDNFNIDLNTSDFLGAIHPVELVSTSKTRIIYEK